MPGKTINGITYYPAKDIQDAVNGKAAAGLHSSTQKRNYKLEYIKNVLREIERDPLENGYAPELKKTIRFAQKKGAPKGYSSYYVDQAVNRLTTNVKSRRLLAVKTAIKNARITRKQIEKTMLKHGKYFPNERFPQKFEFIEKNEKEPDIENQRKFIDDIYKQIYRRNRSIKAAWENYRKATMEILNSKEIPDREKIDLLKSPYF